MDSGCPSWAAAITRFGVRSKIYVRFEPGKNVQKDDKAIVRNDDEGSDMSRPYHRRLVSIYTFDDSLIGQMPRSVVLSC